MIDGRERLRRRILRRAERVRDECRQIRIDAASYNDNHNPGPPIDADPVGELAAWEEWAEGVIVRMGGTT